MKARQVLALGCTGCAVALLFGAERWPGHTIIRGYGGDLAVMLMLVGGLGVVSKMALARRVALALSAAVCVEVMPMVFVGSECTEPEGLFASAARLALGCHYDPWDLVAYALGGIVALVLELSAGRFAARRSA